MNKLRMLLTIICCVSMTACSGSVERWIVNARVHQGEAAMQRGNVRDAELSYRLALRVDPKDAQARTGFVEAAADLAQAQYEQGMFEDALATVDSAQKYDPQNVRLQALRTTLDQAKLDREIVISNYPTYRLTGEQLEKSFASLATTDTEVLHYLHRFNNTYDTQNLSRAVKAAYDLQLEIDHNLNRLVSYRQLVEAGIPTKPGAASETSGSLLPLP